MAAGAEASPQKSKSGFEGHPSLLRRSFAGCVAMTCMEAWVTRKGIHVDRMASAWLIRASSIRKRPSSFVPGKGISPSRGAPLDMFEAEFTHDGDRCTFEVLVSAIRARRRCTENRFAGIVHDIDLKDSKFARPEAFGLDG